jgi:PAS domain S-box-containing protein
VLVLARDMIKHTFLGFTPALVAEKVIQTMGDMLIVLNEDRRIAFVNRSAADALGFRPEEMVGTPIKNVIRGIVQKIRIDKLNMSDFETEAVTKDLQAVPISTGGVNIIDDRGHTIGYAITMRDLRHSRDLIGKLEKSRNELIRSTKELERFNKAMSGRDKKLDDLIAELKKIESRHR